MTQICADILYAKASKKILNRLMGMPAVFLEALACKRSESRCTRLPGADQVKKSLNLGKSQRQI